MIADELRGTALAGHRVDDGPGGTFVIAGIDPDGLLDAWQAARSVVPVTGRWPVLVTTEFSPLDSVVFEGEDPEDFDDLDAAARKIDPWADQGAFEDDPIPADHLGSYLREFPPHVTQRAAEELSLPTTRPVLDRWLYRQLLAEPQLADPLRPWIEHLTGTHSWYQPQEVHLVLLPTVLPWLAPYWLDYWGDDDRTRLSAVQWQWHDRWGAEIVASWGTMLQFVVARQPEPGDQAWELAGQIKRVGGSLQMPQSTLALALPRAEAWFLHDRP